MKLAAKKSQNKRPSQSVLLFSLLCDAMSKCKFQVKKNVCVFHKSGTLNISTVKMYACMPLVHPRILCLTYRTFMNCSAHRYVVQVTLIGHESMLRSSRQPTLFLADLRYSTLT